jgi:hypothetical protein
MDAPMHHVVFFVSRNVQVPLKKIPDASARTELNIGIDR